MKFALISWYGSGTNLFRSIINTHPDIYLHKELFCLAAGFNNRTAQPEEYIVALDAAFAYDKPIVGVDLKYDQITVEVEGYLIQNSISILHVIRDPKRTALRGLLPGNIRSYESILQHCQKIESYIFHARQCFSCLRFLEITYEEMTLGRIIETLPDLLERRIVYFLEAGYHPMKLDPRFSTIPLLQP